MGDTLSDQISNGDGWQLFCFFFECTSVLESDFSDAFSAAPQGFFQVNLGSV